MSKITNLEGTTILEPGDIVTIENSKYRVLELLDENSLLIQINTNRIACDFYNTNLLITGIASGIYSIEKYKEPSIVVDAKNNKYNSRLALITDIKVKYAGDMVAFLKYHPSKIIEELMKKYGIKSRTTLLCTVLHYVQSGYDNASLMPKKHKYPKMTEINHQVRRTNSSGEEIYIITTSDIAKMDEAIEKYKKQVIGITTLHEAYIYLENTYYYEVVNGKASIKGYGYKPSERQFIYYYYKNSSATERKEIKNASKRIRNNNRLLPGGRLEDASHPGALLEIDACEVKVELIGTYRPENNVGKPTLYVMKDVYSKLILAMSIGFEVNKTEALCKLFANMTADKGTFCERYGICGLKPEMWPSNILPQRVHCDRGSDFKSKEYHRICESLKIGKGLVPGAMGSMKGDVEQFFHQIQSELEHFLKGHGLIQKDYDSKHKTEAVLNMLDITKICILYVIYYNNHVMKNFVPSIEMEEAKIRLAPINIWNYGIEMYGAPRPIQNKKQYLEALLVPDKAKISRSGIHYRDLIFYPNDEQECRDHPDVVRELSEKMFMAQKKKKTIRILYDPTTIEYVKYVSDASETIKVPLNKGYRQYTGLDGYTFAMWKEYAKQRNERKRKLLEQDNDLEAGFIETMKDIVEDVDANNPTKPVAKNMKANRAYEAKMDAPRESVSAIQNEEEPKQINEENDIPALPMQEDPVEQLAEQDQTSLPPLQQESNDEESKEINGQREESMGKYEYNPEEHFKDIMRLL